MPYRITFYCPDRHLSYDGRTPYMTGVGGGVTARVRMAKALAQLGHQVEMVVNCPESAEIDGVEYRPLGQAGRLTCDILILNTSGGDLDLRPALDLDLDARLRIVWVQGVPKPMGLMQVGFDVLYAVSNFILEVAHEDWGVPRDRIFVGYNAFEESLFTAVEQRAPGRDPYRLVYLSHPSKGLESSLDIMRRLRLRDPRFHLEVYGGPGLWGGEETPFPQEEGVAFHGLVGQRELAQRLMQCGYMLSLQSREEPGALVLGEAMRAGCIVFASPVGAFPEYIEHARDGFLIPGDHQADSTREYAAMLLLQLAQQPDWLAYVRRNARRVLWDSRTMARAWLGHWRWWFLRREGGPVESSYPPCRRCGGRQLALADGYHCLGCGRYTRGGSDPMEGRSVA